LREAVPFRGRLFCFLVVEEPGFISSFGRQAHPKIFFSVKKSGKKCSEVLLSEKMAEHEGPM
jgi:hypothetical protein